MPANRYRSRSYKRTFKRTPGGKTILQYKKKKPSKHICAECKKQLHGVPRGRPYEIRKLAKSKKRPNVLENSLNKRQGLNDYNHRRVSRKRDNHCF
jgi:large subunit ribosomal protein L34e